MKPSPGRIVLYTALNGEVYVDIVARAYERPTLLVFFDDVAPDDVMHAACVPSVLMDVPEGTDPGTWSWPPRVS